MGEVRVHLLPELVEPAELADQGAVVIDVLRASTTIVEALANGAIAVIPVLEVDEALERARSLEGALLGGERHGRRIDGFHLGNSPSEYHAEVVHGRRIVFTTTNGTRALHRCRHAAVTWIGCFANLSAVAAAAARHDRVALMCAGTGGEVALEDTLMAGALVERLVESGFEVANDSARIAALVWRAGSGDDTAASAECNAWTAMMMRSRGGRNLVELGMAGDVIWAGRVDRHTKVPSLDAERGLL